MEYKLTTVPYFDKEFEALKKKYALIDNNQKGLKNKSKKNPKSGTEIGKDLYKISMDVTSRERVKSGGDRIIHLSLFARVDDNNRIVLLYIYDKSDRENITDEEIRQSLKDI